MDIITYTAIFYLKKVQFKNKVRWKNYEKNNCN